MDLYKVILVDDEEEVREAIRKRIDWEEIGFTVAGTAENGEEAPKQQTIKRSTPKVGRNDPCPCGSGLKYKKCCGK